MVLFNLPASLLFLQDWLAALPPSKRCLGHSAREGCVLWVVDSQAQVSLPSHGML